MTLLCLPFVLVGISLLLSFPVLVTFPPLGLIITSTFLCLYLEVRLPADLQGVGVTHLAESDVVG